MSMPHLDVRVLRWGSSLGLRVRKADATRLGIRPGQDLRISIPDLVGHHDLAHWPRLDLGGHASTDHDGGFGPL